MSTADEGVPFPWAKADAPEADAPEADAPETDADKTEPAAQTRPDHGRKARGTDTLGRFMDQLEGLEDEATVECVRYRRQGGTELVQKWSLETFDPYEIQKVWGGGKYLLRVRAANGDYLKSATIHVAGKARNPDIPEPKNDDSSTLELVKGMRDEWRELIQGVRNPPREAADTSAIELALSIVGAFQAAQQPYVEALLAKTKTGPESGEMLELFFKGMEAARDLQPPTDPMVPVVSQLALPLLQQLQGGGPRTEVSPMHDNPPAAGGPADAPRRPPWDILLSPWIHHLQSWAAKRKDPRMRAAFVLDEIPDEAVQLFGEQLERGESFLAEFFTLHPETKVFEVWYRDFWAAIGEGLSWMDEGNEIDDNDGSENPDLADGGEADMPDA